MADEDAKFREYLVAHGYDVSQLGLTSESAESVDGSLEHEKDPSLTDVKVAV